MSGGVDGAVLTIRPIEPADAEALMRFHAKLSVESTRLRFFSPHPRLSAREIEWFTHVDHHRREALVALAGPDLVAVARFEALGATADAEVAFVVADDWQHHGLGTALLEALVTRARAEGIDRLVADTLCDNRPMIEVFKHVGYPLTRTLDHGVVHLTFPIA